MFGENLKKYRTEKGLSQNDVAEKLFVTRQCVSKWEKGITEPDLQTLNQISELLGVSVDALIKENNDIGGQNSSNHNVGFFIANILISVFCVILFIVVWRFLPQTVPAHWSGGVVDRYGSRNEVFLNLIVPVVLLGVDIFMFFTLRRVKDRRAVYISHGVIAVFQVAFLILIVALYAKYLNNVISFITCISVDLITCVSVAMHPKISKQNHLLGVRTSDTLKSITVWNKTNTLACYLFTGCSVIVFIINMVWISRFSLLCLLAYIVLTAIVIIYSKIIGKAED